MKPTLIYRAVASMRGSEIKNQLYHGDTEGMELHGEKNKCEQYLIFTKGTFLIW